MNNQILISRLYSMAIASLSSANKGNPFISKAEAMRDINHARRLDRQHCYYSMLR